MIGGVYLEDSTEKNSIVALLDESLEIHRLNTNEEIVDLLMEREVEVMAINAAFSEEHSEEDLIEEGYNFIPSNHQNEIKKRAKALDKAINTTMGVDSPETIRFDPMITSKELAVDSEQDLESYGIPVQGLKSAKEFDALLGAVTARFYQQNQCEDHGLVIPTPD